MAEVAYAGASRVYPGSPGVRAVDKLDLDVGEGEFLVLVGPSGSGKSTALRMLAGLEDIDEGSVHIGDRDVTGVQPKDRDIAMVFQSYALYPHMSVSENMGFALKLRGIDKSSVRAKVSEAAELLDLRAYLDRKPKALSGGQRQRVAMGRAIVREPSVFLMDEPLSNLDAKLRVETRSNIAALQRRLGTTTVYVTHDQVEAMTMGHRVAVLADGCLQQVATPRELYRSPCNSFVAGFIGSPAMNLLTVGVDDSGADLAGYRVSLPRTALALAGPEPSVTLGLRPESLRITGPAEPGVDMAVGLTEELGADAFVYASTTIGSSEQQVTVRIDGRDTPRVGEPVRIGLRDPDDVHVFSTIDGTRLN